jgi:hypothetical protein
MEAAVPALCMDGEEAHNDRFGKDDVARSKSSTCWARLHIDYPLPVIPVDRGRDHVPIVRIELKDHSSDLARFSEVDH